VLGDFSSNVGAGVLFITQWLVGLEKGDMEQRPLVLTKLKVSLVVLTF
jgi:hypothetical protein